MLGLAVGIDYALFIISRHRTQVLDGMDPEESAGRAVGTAGSAVVFAGATVVIALAALSVVGIPFLTAMGLAAAGDGRRRRAASRSRSSPRCSASPALRIAEGQELRDRPARRQADARRPLGRPRHAPPRAARCC